MARLSNTIARKLKAKMRIFAFSFLGDKKRLRDREILSQAGREGVEPPTPGFGDRCSANCANVPEKWGW